MVFSSFSHSWSWTIVPSHTLLPNLLMYLSFSLVSKRLCDLNSLYVIYVHTMTFICTLSPTLTLSRLCSHYAHSMSSVFTLCPLCPLYMSSMSILCTLNVINIHSTSSMLTEEEAVTWQEAWPRQRAGLFPHGRVSQKASSSGTQPLRRQRAGAGAALQGKVPFGTVE